MSIYDISVVISPGQTPTYPGDPGIEIISWAAIARGAAANVSLLHFGTHTGTHIDAPAHFIEGAPPLSSLSLDSLIGEARVVELPDEATAIEPRHIAAPHVPAGTTRVLFKTRNSQFWQDNGGEFREDFTYVTPEAARALVRSGIKLIGIDYLSIEQFKSQDFAAHKTLLGAGVVIVEGLNLSGVPAGIYELICLPLKLVGDSGDGAPARAILRTQDWPL